MLRSAGAEPRRGSAGGGVACRLASPLRLRLSPWMWSLTLGCIAGSVWSSSPRGRQDNAAVAAGPPGQASSYTNPELHLQDTRYHPSAPVSIYRSPASLRGGHAENERIHMGGRPPGRVLTKGVCLGGLGSHKEHPAGGDGSGITRG
ncbi:hypothetical protein DPEC_G00292630 [Dallia pectoralis]|uniref:Uncharacterized protein n=1 Tax=Dallia pectoralis TaxID=75939 RepID=A0ACC2FI25_DALPE|nr:hypothetical protein DPEC_G00292630 [Dallia pectoralis]